MTTDNFPPPDPDGIHDDPSANDALPELTAEERAAMDALPPDFVERILRGERPLGPPRGLIPPPCHIPPDWHDGMTVAEMEAGMDRLLGHREPTPVAPPVPQTHGELVLEVARLEAENQRLFGADIQLKTLRSKLESCEKSLKQSWKDNERLEDLVSVLRKACEGIDLVYAEYMALRPAPCASAFDAVTAAMNAAHAAIAKAR